ncbi:EAL domain-containing protein [Litchfieldia alkalitelluris]|uniref:EAL domain-containing protein n=1 Tax=Litchfieldia alkalitelluris TaxID=304268 RepID=UPI000997E06D|nr:EAL domain-containing protein [Litchfieldia alkalitelluris]
MKNKIEELLDNLSLLELSLEHTRTAVVITDKNGALTYVNKYTREMYGLPDEVLSPEQWSKFFTALYPDGKTPIDRADLPLFRLLNGESVHDYELCVRTKKDDKLNYYILNGDQLKDKNNEIVGTFLMAVNITIPKLLEQELKVTVENYDKLIENSPNPIIIHKDGIILFANPEAAKILGAKNSNEIIGKHLLNFIHSDSKEGVLQRFNQVKSGQKLEFIETKLTRLDEETRVVETSSINVVYRGQEAIMSVGKDITERNRVREQLEKSRQQYQSLFEFHPDAVFMFNLEGNFVSANYTCEKVSGYTPEQLIGTSFIPLLIPEDLDRVLTNFQKTIEGAPQNFECSIFHKQGHAINLSVTNVPIVVDGKTVGVYCIAKDMTEQRNMQEKIHHMAYYDSLTNLPNRQLLSERLKEVLTESEQNNHSFAVLFIDLDHFKFINDTMGHDVGDLLLKEVAKRLQLSIRDQDMVSRLGGDEFIILLNNVEKEVVNRIALRIIDQFRSPLDLKNVEEVLISPSIGISLYPDDANNIDAMVKYADTAMYMAKAKGRNNFQYYTSELSQILQRKVSIEKSLRKAIHNHEMEIYYQPIINLKSGDLIGAEALLRWTNPEMGVISPVEFIPIAEETGIIQEIGEWVLKEACTQNKQWMNQGHDNLQIMVNISIRQLQNRNFYQKVEKILKEVGLDAEHLVLEITEGILHDPHDSIVILNQLREKGVKIALDDFGTGYSSLSYLKHLPIDRLKIDRSFIQDLITNPNAVSMVKSIIDIGRNLDLKIVAEGIETEEQLAVLKELQCTNGQGFFISEPLCSKTYENTILKELL